jgi:hypothetical protein
MFLASVAPGLWCTQDRDRCRRTGNPRRRSGSFELSKFVFRQIERKDAPNKTANPAILCAAGQRFEVNADLRVPRPEVLLQGCVVRPAISVILGRISGLGTRGLTGLTNLGISLTMFVSADQRSVSPRYERADRLVMIEVGPLQSSEINVGVIAEHDIAVSLE